ncbi:MAG: hypothetical protein AAGD38_16645 [Acidobacteriota bacterium]
MAVHFLSTTLTFNRPGVGTWRVNFAKPIISAGANIQGFDIGFAPDDHELRTLSIKVQNVEWSGTEVIGEVVFLLQDDSDHEGKGTITVGVAAELE